MTLRIKIDGPFTGSYSLALVNREMALALEALNPGSVSLCFESDPHWNPENDHAYLQNHPQVDRLYRRSLKRDPADVVLYNSYPPIVSKVEGALTLTNSYGWEESLFPKTFATGFNQELDGLTVMSSYVLKTMQDNGVGLPMAVVGLGVDHMLRVPSDPDPSPASSGRGFRFLHVSSCFPRKGLDVLLKAYGRAFSAKDDVSLVIKTFPNPHNEAAAMVRAFLQGPDAPDVILIDDDIGPSRLLTLYRESHCLVAPSRGEGFGLPMAEAMALKIPVITTGFGGQTDFCTPNTAWLIDYSFQKAQTHLTTFGSVWAEPDADHLAHLMRELFLADPGEIRLRTDAAHDLVTTHYTWKRAAERLIDFIARLQAAGPRRDRIKTGLVTTWNSRCGIAEYSKYLSPYLLHELDVTVIAADFGETIQPDEPNVRRIWNGDNLHQRIPAIVEASSMACVIINFHFGFFPLASFQALLDSLDAKGVSVIIIFHTTQAEGPGLAAMGDSLKKARRLLVHGVEDLNRLKEMGLSENAALFLHGVTVRKEHPRPSAMILPKELRYRRLIASFGFLMPHKGTMELIEAFALLSKREPDLGLLLVTSLYPKEEVRVHYEACLQAIDRLGLRDRARIIPDFLPLDDALSLLGKADLVVYPYQHTGESSSAAVRIGLGAGRPVACTPLPIFDDVAGAVHFLPGCDPQALSMGIGELLKDRVLLNSKNEACQKWLSLFAWPHAGQRLSGLVRSLSF